MKILLVTIFISISLLTKAQEKSTQQFNRILIGVNFSPGMAYRLLSNNDGEEFTGYLINSRDDRERLKFGFSFGLSTCFNLTERFAIESGIVYSNRGYGFTLTQSELTFDPNPGPEVPQKIVFAYHLNYIDIPLKFKFFAGQGRVKFVAGVGASLNIFLKESYSSFKIYSDKSKLETGKSIVEYKRINVSPIVSAGIDWNIKNNMFLRVEPYFEFGVLKISDTPVATSLYAGGIGFTYYFGV